MARSKIGFITGVGGNPTGIGDFVNDLNDVGIPAVIMANDTSTGLSDAIDSENILVFRVVVDGTEYWSVPDYNLSPYDAAVDHWDKIEPRFDQIVRDNRDKIWIQPINEVDHERSDWLGKFAVEIAKIANIQGYKVAMFAFSSGEPEPEDWKTPGMVSYLQYCQSNPEYNAIALHEYDLYHQGMEKTFPWHIGRFLELFQACDDLGIDRPKVLITEFGWSLNNIPSIPQCMVDIDYAARLYAQHEEILGAGIWYLGSGFNNIANKVNALIGPVKDYNLQADFPDPEPTDNYLVNGSFENGWYNLDGIPELQVPNDWELWYAEEDIVNPYDSNPWSVFRRPETRVLPKNQLPQGEQDTFVLHGNYCTKIFKRHGSIYYSLGQLVNSGKWKLKIKVYPDLIDGYNPDGTKIFADDPNSCIIWVEINGSLKSQEVRPVPGEYNLLSFELDLDQPSYIEVFFMQPFALVNNGCFFDDWRLEEMSDNCNAREDGYHRVVWVPNGNMSKDQYLALCAEAYDRGKITVGFSYDDAGIGCGLKSKTAVLYNIPQPERQTYIDWYNTHYPGTVVEFQDFPVAPSTD